MSKIYFEAYGGLIFQLVHQFYISSYLLESQKLENNSSIFNTIAYSQTVISSLQQSFLLNITNLFDDRDKRSFSIYSLLQQSKNAILIKDINKEIENKFRNTIEFLKGWRDKFLAHKEVEFVINRSLLYSEFPIDDLELEKMMQFLINLLDLIKKDFDTNNSKNYVEYYDFLKKNCIRDTKFILENGLRKV